MQRRLLVMRHAKSSWRSAAPTDHARPLNGRGRTAAPWMAERLLELDLCPEVVLSSDSARTRETWQRCAPILPTPALVRFTDTLYFGRMDHILRELTAVPDQHHTLLTLGHNPTWEQLVTWLSGQRVVMKTANIALLEATLPSLRDGFGTPGRWQLTEVLRPR